LAEEQARLLPGKACISEWWRLLGWRLPTPLSFGCAQDRRYEVLRKNGAYDSAKPRPSETFGLRRLGASLRRQTVRLALPRHLHLRRTAGAVQMFCSPEQLANSLTC